MESAIANETVQIAAHIVGFAGMITILTAYFGIEKGWFDRSDSRYYLINLSGAVFLTLSLLVHFNLGSLILELFWIGISLSGLKRVYREKMRE